MALPCAKTTTPAPVRRNACRGCAAAAKTSEQILEKLAPATLTPIANMAAERAGTSGTNPFRED